MSKANNLAFIEEDNVITLSDWKLKNQERLEEKSLGAYFNVLSFNELLNESMEMVNTLKDTYLNSELALQSKMLLMEFNRRLAQESKEFSDSLYGMKRDIEKRINEIKEIL